MRNADLYGNIILPAHSAHEMQVLIYRRTVKETLTCSRSVSLTLGTHVYEIIHSYSFYDKCDHDWLYTFQKVLFYMSCHKCQATDSAAQAMICQDITAQRRTQ